jgi:adsorption protein B
LDGLELFDALTRETMLFAATGFLIGGLDDLVVDLIYIVRRVVDKNARRQRLADIPMPSAPSRIAILVGAWDEAAVIGQMITSALARLDHPDYRLYVGLYPNDRATIDAAAAVAGRDSRVRLVIGERDGPTTKADNLNTLWRSLIADDAREGCVTKAVVIHDAEDVIHPAELRLFDALIGEYAVVQLPVLPLVVPGSPLISGHYADEFATSHSSQLVVRTAIAAAMPLAGTGCAIAVPTLTDIAAERGGDPFDAASLTEDYELGLRIAERGGRGMFARVEDAHGELVAVRAYFPATIAAATRQKARWMTGIALAGWDRTGWARAGAVADHWMRMRDRRGPLAVLVLAVAYAAMLLWGLQPIVHWAVGVPTGGDALARWLMMVTTALLVWRLALRVAFTWRCYGWRQGVLALPRFVVGNIIALMAAPRAMARYLVILRGGLPRWDKTQHVFPTLAEAPR